MNDALQSGQHPDADQLSAFAEHALPPHEQQQTLAHLAVCADCRAIVYLAQVPELAAAAPQPAAVRRPWFSAWKPSGWNLAIPATLALAALAFVTVHLRKVGTDRLQVATDKTAHLEEPVAPAQPRSPTPAPSAQPEAAPKPLPAPIVKAVGEPPASGLAESVPQQPVLAVRQSEPNASAGFLGGRSSTALPRAAAGVSSSTTSADEAHQSIQGAVFKPNGQIASAPTAATPQQSGLRSADPTRHELHSSASQYNAIAGTAQSNLQALQAAPPPPPAASAMNQTAVINGPMLDSADVSSGQVIENRAYNSVSLSTSQKKQPALPSHLPTVSTIANAREELAIDSAGSLFRSQDAGVTWQPVSIQWTGRAVKLQLAPLSDARTLAKDKSSVGALAAAKTAPATPPQASFELTTDTGQVWTSTDGQSWKRK